MSALSKIFVVLLMVFSVAFAMMTIQFVAKTHEWQGAYEKQQEAYTAARAQIADLEGRVKNMQAQQVAQLAKLTQQIGQVQSSSDDKARTISDLNAKLGQLQRQKTSLATQLAQSLASLKLEVSERQQYASDNQTLRDDILNSQKQNGDLMTANNLLTQKVSVAEQRIRDLKSTVDAIQKENVDLRKRLALVGAGKTVQVERGRVRPAAATPVSAVPIKGLVTGVDTNRISVSIGASDGVKQDMSFIIYRGGSFLANMKIVKVEPTQSAGIMSDVRGEVKLNDRVTNFFNY